MGRLRSLAAAWMRLRDAARRELLRDPNVILFDRGSDQVAAGLRSNAHGS